ncbi:MAG: trigger factor [Dehalococcoidia bacterium]|nr:trigger factor [Dehalococcoidia bacterium]
MKVATERTTENQAVLNVELEPEEMEQWLDKAYKRLVQRVVVPGFRKGKAPRPILEVQVGRERLVEEAIQILVPETTEKLIKEQSLEAFAEPKFEVEKTNPVTFKATIPLKPDVDLGDYASIRVATEPVLITDDQVTKVIDEIRWEQAPWVPVERPVQMGDMLILDIDSKVDGRPFMSQKGATHRPIAEVPDPVPGFNEKLAGMAKGETREFTIAFAADHPARQWAGRSYAFKVTIHEVKEKKLPELNDEFAKGVGDGFEGLEKLTERVRENLRASAEAEARKRYEEQALDALVQQAKITFPPVLTEREVEHILSDQERELRASNITWDDYLRRTGKTLEQLQEEVTPVAAKRVVRSLALSILAEKERIQVAPAEVDAEMESIVKGSGENADRIRQALSTKAGRDSVARSLLTRKTVERLVATARGEQPIAPPAETPAIGKTT